MPPYSNSLPHRRPSAIDARLRRLLDCRIGSKLEDGHQTRGTALPALLQTGHCAVPAPRYPGLAHEDETPHSPPLPRLRQPILRGRGKGPRPLRLESQARRQGAQSKKGGGRRRPPSRDSNNSENTKRTPASARRALVPSGKPAVPVRSPGVSGAQVVAVAEAHGAITKFGAVAVPLFAAVKPGALTPVVATVLVMLNTSKRSSSDILSRSGHVLARRPSKRGMGSIQIGLLGSQGTRLSPPSPSRLPVNACGRLEVEEKPTDSKLGRPLARVRKPSNSQPLIRNLATLLPLCTNVGFAVNVPTKRCRWSRLPLPLSLLYAPL